jgi:hypothetical protein
VNNQIKISYVLYKMEQVHERFAPSSFISNYLPGSRMLYHKMGGYVETGPAGTWGKAMEKLEIPLKQQSSGAYVAQRGISAAGYKNRTSVGSRIMKPFQVPRSGSVPRIVGTSGDDYFGGSAEIFLNEQVVKQADSSVDRRVPTGIFLPSPPPDQQPMEITPTPMASPTMPETASQLPVDMPLPGPMETVQQVLSVDISKLMDEYLQLADPAKVEDDIAMIQMVPGEQKTLEIQKYLETILRVNSHSLEEYFASKPKLVTRNDRKTELLKLFELFKQLLAMRENMLKPVVSEISGQKRRAENGDRKSKKQRRFGPTKGKRKTTEPLEQAKRQRKFGPTDGKRRASITDQEPLAKRRAA